MKKKNLWEGADSIAGKAPDSHVPNRRDPGKVQVTKIFISLLYSVIVAHVLGVSRYHLATLARDRDRWRRYWSPLNRMTSDK